MTVAMTKRTRRPQLKVDYNLGMCYMCKGLHDFDDEGNNEKLLTCFDCQRNVHAVCYQLDKTAVEIIQTYDWQCNDCKSCLVCQSKSNENKIVICSRCDRGYHTFCCNPSLKSIPRDDWYCSLCSSMPSPLPSPKIPPLTEDQQNNSTYRLRPSPTHSSKFVANMAAHTAVTTPPPSATITRHSKTKIKPLKITLNLKEANMDKFDTSDAPPRKRGRPPSKKRKRSVSPALPPPSPSEEDEPVEAEVAALAKEKDTAKQTDEELFFQTFGHKLTEKQASTKKGIPNELDRLKFEKAKLKAEKKSLIQQQQEERQLKKQQKQQKQQQRHHTRHSSSSNHNSSPYPTFEPPKISKIYFNHYIIDTWYVAPYPEEYSQNSTLFICEFCMKYMKSPFIAQRHISKCKVRHPPGDEIYRDGKISIFEVDGRKNKMYCQNLCLLAKLFLDHKTLYYDVEPFLFYVMTETSTTTLTRKVKKDGTEEEQEQEMDDGTGCHFVGYFSKEKRSSMNYNVSCILTLPVFQRKGYGQFLIDFSYLLSKRESKTGTPERPLSDLGLLSYQSYWKNVIYRELIQQKEGQQISIDELSHKTSLTSEDIISTLQKNNMIQYNANGKHSISINVDEIKSHLDKLDKKNYLKLNPEKLTWIPFVLSRDRLAALLASSSASSDRSDDKATATAAEEDTEEVIDVTN